MIWNPEMECADRETMQELQLKRLQQTVAYEYANVAPYREKRNERNRKMIARLNGLLADFTIDYDADVLPLSMQHEGGSVTERHLLFAMAQKMIVDYAEGVDEKSKLKEMLKAARRIEPDFEIED